MKIAVIGAGIFGVTAALKLSNYFSVDLYEKNSDIFQSASGINQYRIHRGYHYPRSKDTVSSVLKAEKNFNEQFHDAIINYRNHYYCISKRDSLTSAEQYLEFCDENNLEYQLDTPTIIDKNSVELCVKVKESLFDPMELKKICSNKLKNSNISLFLNTMATNEILQEYDFVIIATYAYLNQLLEKFPNDQLDYQFELCEKPLVRLPSSFHNTSMVIMDGPFMSVDPYGKSDDLFVLGNVVHAIHQNSIGKLPQFDEKFNHLLDSGIVKNPNISNFHRFIESASEFMPEIKKAEHIGSMYTIRTVLPKVEKTDERPTIVRKINNQTFTIFSGKIPTCVDAADELTQSILNN